MHAKNERHHKIRCFLAQYGYTKIAQRIFKYSDTQYTGVTLDAKNERHHKICCF